MTKRIPGITYLKAFLPLLVIACHARPFGTSASMNVAYTTLPDWKDVCYLNIFTLAVPLFYLISFYLYLLKRDKMEGSAGGLLFRRIVYFAGLFLGARIIYWFFGIGNLWIPERGWVRNLYRLFFSGGDTLLYYLEQMAYYLLLLECLITVSNRFHLNKNRFYLSMGFGGVLLIALCGIAAPEALRIEALRYFSPLGFFPLVPFALYFFEIRNERKPRWIGAALLAGLLAAIVEWRLLPNACYLQNGYTMALPSYARVSVVLLSCGIFFAALQKNQSPGLTVEKMAALSLYVYITHQVVIKLLGNRMDSPFVNYLIVTACTYSICFIAYVIIKKTKSFIQSHARGS